MTDKSDHMNPIPESYRPDSKPFHKTPKELEGRFGPRPLNMTVDDLIREATDLGIQHQWDRYLAQLAEEEAAHEI